MQHRPVLTFFLLTLFVVIPVSPATCPAQPQVQPNLWQRVQQSRIGQWVAQNKVLCGFIAGTVLIGGSYVVHQRTFNQSLQTRLDDQEKIIATLRAQLGTPSDKTVVATGIRGDIGTIQQEIITLTNKINTCTTALQGDAKNEGALKALQQCMADIKTLATRVGTPGDASTSPTGFYDLIAKQKKVTDNFTDAVADVAAAKLLDTTRKTFVSMAESTARTVARQEVDTIIQARLEPHVAKVHSDIKSRLDSTLTAHKERTKDSVGKKVSQLLTLGAISQQDLDNQLKDVHQSLAYLDEQLKLRQAALPLDPKVAQLAEQTESLVQLARAFPELQANVTTLQARVDALAPATPVSAASTTSTSSVTSSPPLPAATISARTPAAATAVTGSPPQSTSTPMAVNVSSTPAESAEAVAARQRKNLAMLGYR
ncbi:MAG TPA: hypothetical protein VLG71_01525 [Candidatus Limnocylindria bacterium]|nr:hypothetical protein [Candidatus Limnocylindria bacterium]